MLHAIDIPVAVALIAEPEANFARLHEMLGISTSTAHAAVGRLEAAGLVRPGTRTVNGLALREFLAHGVRYVFPARPGRQVRGVPTAHAGPALLGRVISDQALVWPDPRGAMQGLALAPLYPGAVELPDRSPATYSLLGLVDALRVGRARERSLALEELDRALAGAA